MALMIISYGMIHKLNLKREKYMFQKSIILKTADFLNRHLQAEKVLPMLKAVLAGERIPEY